MMPGMWHHISTVLTLNDSHANPKSSETIPQ